ncbi:metallophosphoesterase family protein [Bradyrhizobium sp. SZCCHNS30582]|uniref:metallophosphoesterase family protein n=1 Tax=Bradyrhizobium sp. SZCCHNS30582 TaxID=3057327 RepID=UPI002916A871|nr:metallophosphoesterase [Bradyrhizobium sp. SZCCHNS30582]
MRFIQIGDIHLPSAAQSKGALDDKDARFPSDLKTIISNTPIKQAFRKIYELVESGEIAGLVIMGDLTDFGKIDGYAACARYISTAFQVGANGQHSDMPLGIIPGNHDVDRALAKNASFTAKFKPLVAALANEGLPSIPVTDPIWLTFSAGGIAVRLVLLNSCWGCGSKEFIPDEFRDDVQDAIEKALSRGQPDKQIAAYYDRQFDTPAFSNDTIEKLLNAIPNASDCPVLVVAAHHNLLPQRLTRLAPYTELVNSGAVRGALQELDVPVLYLHGHIHEDPIELLQRPGGNVVATIAAPEIVKGFNVIELVFTRTSLPLTCRIIKWRFDQGGYLKQQKPVTIPLIGSRRRSHNDSLAPLYSLLLKHRELYWNQLKEEAKAIFASNVEEELEEALELLFSDGRIEIYNYELASYNWIVGARV